jgi:K+/H+ antiporter YhaU regulatory subunit KhtT
MRETNHERKRPILALLKLRGLRAAAISSITIENFVIAEEFGQIDSLSNLSQPRIQKASVKIGNQISHKSSVFQLTLA